MSLRSWAPKACFSPLSFALPYLVPRAKGRVVLTSFHGRGYRGNPRVLFERLLAHPELRPIWLATEPAIVARLQQEHGQERAALCHSWRGVWALARARAIVLSHGITDLPWLHLNRKALVIQSFHGLPSKRGEYLGPRPGLWQRFILWRRFWPIDVFLSSSDFVSRLYGARFGLPAWRFAELGYPAFDALATPPVKPQAPLLPAAPAHDKLILYAPTFRQERPTRLFPFADWNPAALAAFLEGERAIIALRLHPNERQNLGPLLAISPRILVADDTAVEDVSDLLRQADLIVTDYSSIYLEGLLRDTPAVFLPYDLESYERGLAFDYDALTPGPKVTTQAAFLAACRQALHHPEQHRTWREVVRRLFFAQPEGGATERLVAFLEERALRPKKGAPLPRRAGAASAPHPLTRLAGGAHA